MRVCCEKHATSRITVAESSGDFADSRLSLRLPNALD
jgi:hypothetical protein